MAKIPNNRARDVLNSLIPEALDTLTELLAVRLGGRNKYYSVTPFSQGANWQHGVKRPSKPVSRVLYSDESER